MFWGTCGVVACTLLLKIWPLVPMVISAETRERVRTTVEGTAAREGWLLSDIVLLSVSPETLRLAYRPHLRGPDSDDCLELHTYTGTLRPCP